MPCENKKIWKLYFDNGNIPALNDVIYMVKKPEDYEYEYWMLLMGMWETLKVLNNG